MLKIDRLFTGCEGMDLDKEYFLSNSLDAIQEALERGDMECEPLERSSNPDYPFWGCATGQCFKYAYDVPDKLREHNVMTNIELAKWLAKGNGLVKWKGADEVYTYLIMDEDILNAKASEDILIRAWDEEEWHRPYK